MPAGISERIAGVLEVVSAFAGLKASRWPMVVDWRRAVVFEALPKPAAV
jgi:hypothetical protein